MPPVINGCLYYVPGSQKTATWQNAGIGKNQADLFKVYPQWHEIAPIGCPCPAGSAVFHNGLCAHGAGANMTNKPRRAMTCAYMPDGETFNGTRNILPEDYFQTLTVGDVLNDDKINPLIWSSAHETGKITALRFPLMALLAGFFALSASNVCLLCLLNEERTKPGIGPVMVLPAEGMNVSSFPARPSSLCEIERRTTIRVRILHNVVFIGNR